MRKTQIALAAVALVASSAALAQEAVSVYGNIDAGVMRSQVAQGEGVAKLRNIGVESGLLSPNFFGIRASEDLGGGLKADVHVQSSFNATSGGATNTFGFTQSDIGIGGDFGTVRLGSTVDPFWAQGVAGFDAAGGSNIGSAVTPVIDMGLSVIFPKNTITYLSPNAGGLTFAGQIRTSSKPDTTTVGKGIDNGYSATLNYAAGGFTLGGGIVQNKRDIDGLGTPDTKLNGNFLGAGLDLGGPKINLVYLNNKAKSIPDDGSVTKLNTVGVNGSIPFGAATLIAGYYSGDMKTDGVTDGKGKLLHITGIYALSKRTSVFANYLSVKNTDSEIYGLHTGSAVGTATVGTSSSMTAGIRHTF